MKTDLQKIDGNIKRIVGMGKALLELVQTTAVMILDHGRAHGDVSRAIKLVQAVPGDSNKRFLANWFAYYGNIQINLTNGKCSRIAKTSNRYRNVGDDGFDIDGAKVNLWHEPNEDAGNRRDAPINTFYSFASGVVTFFDRQMKAVSDPENRAFIKDENQRARAVAELTALSDVSKRFAAAGSAEEVQAEADRLRETAKGTVTVEPAKIVAEATPEEQPRQAASQAA